MRRDKITPIYIEGLYCVDNTILTVCDALRGEYEKALWDSWRVSYKTRTRIGDGFCYFPKRISENVRKIYGIEFSPLGKFDARKTKSLLRRQVEKQGMVVIGIRTNCCPWQKSYGALDSVVYFLIVTEVTKDGIMCTDTMPQRQGALMGWEDVECGKGDY